MAEIERREPGARLARLRWVSDNAVGHSLGASLANLRSG
jgi:hypothetical protein